MASSVAQVKVRQVVGDGDVYRCQIEGVSQEQLDPVVVNTVFRSFNETARDDKDLSDEQAAAMRFVTDSDEPPNLFSPNLFSPNPEPAFVIANQVKCIADKVEKQLREDAILTRTDDEVINGILMSHGEDQVDYSRPIDVCRIKDHLMDVFSHLLNREEIVNFSVVKVLIRFVSGIAYCYNFCKKILLRQLSQFVPKSVIDLMCSIASVFFQHLVNIGFDRITQNFGGWAQMASNLVLTRFVRVAGDYLGPSKWFFAGAAIVSAGIAVYLHYTGQ